MLLVVQPEAKSWVDNPVLQEETLGRNAHNIPSFDLNLDDAPIDRWNAIGPLYANTVPDIINYLAEFLPAIILPKVFSIAATWIDYPGWGADYSDEMRSLASAMKCDLGLIVICNLIYQVEHIGQNCSASNTTGPGCNETSTTSAFLDDLALWDSWPETPQIFDAVSGPLTGSGRNWKPKNVQYPGVPGICTSTVAQAPDGTIYHGRNLDWNLSVVLRKNMVNINYYKNGKLLFVGTQLVPFIGILSGMMPGVFTYSMDARNQGGYILANILEAMLQGGQTPAQHARRAFETSVSFAQAVTWFDTGNLVNDVYYIVGGARSMEGVVVTRNRTGGDNNLWWLADVSADPNGWFRLETNYDHWTQPPASDNRRDPGDANMEAMGQAGLNVSALLGVMTTWPTFNAHTDMTGVFHASANVYTTMWWDDDTVIEADDNEVHPSPQPAVA
jgi:hypothetical protein